MDFFGENSERTKLVRVCNLEVKFQVSSIILARSRFLTKTYSELCQTTKMERFVKIINGFHPLTSFTKCSISDVLHGTENTSVRLARMGGVGEIVNISSCKKLIGSIIRKHYPC